MATNIWQESRKSIPMDGDSRVTRIEFGKSDIGARKSHIAGVAPKNGNSIQHVSGAKAK